MYFLFQTIQFKAGPRGWKFRDYFLSLVVQMKNEWIADRSPINYETSILEAALGCWCKTWGQAVFSSNPILLAALAQVNTWPGTIHKRHWQEKSCALFPTHQPTHISRLFPSHHFDWLVPALLFRDSYFDFSYLWPFHLVNFSVFYYL